MKAQWIGGSWTIPALLAACVLVSAPGPRAAAGPPSPRDAPFQLAQADTTTVPGDDEEDDIPANLRDPNPPVGFPGHKDEAPDTTGAAAARQDSTRTFLSTQPETLQYVQPGSPPTQGPATMGAKPGPAPTAKVPPKPKGALFGLGPTVVILGLAVIHFLVLRTVGG